MNDKSKIKFCLYLHGWSYSNDNKPALQEHAKYIVPLEYRPEMKGHIFCPECSAPLFRSPEEKDYAKDGRQAYFAHARGVSTDCSLRVQQTEGKRYLNEEEAKQAIEDGELVVVQSFKKYRPEPPNINGEVFYNKEPNEDQNGPEVVCPIGRHNGEEFKLPAKITTVRSLCRSFNHKLNRYFVLPGQRAALTLRQQLINIKEVAVTCDAPRLYIGRITNFKSCGLEPTHLCLVHLDFLGGGGYKDFCLKASNEKNKEHGIGPDSIGRIVIAYGKITESGVGLCIEKLGWGEFAILPSKYEHLIDIT